MELHGHRMPFKKHNILCAEKNRAFDVLDYNFYGEHVQLVFVMKISHNLYMK